MSKNYVSSLEKEEIITEKGEVLDISHLEEQIFNETKIDENTENNSNNKNIKNNNNSHIVKKINSSNTIKNNNNIHNIDNNSNNIKLSNNNNKASVVEVNFNAKPKVQNEPK